MQGKVEVKREVEEEGKEKEETGGTNEEMIILGKGNGIGKKNAKLMAAKDALSKLIPGVEFDEEGIAVGEDQ